MRITSPVTDYIRASVLTTQGDLVVRGAAVPERKASGAWGKVLTSIGAGGIPTWFDLYSQLLNTGDMLINSGGAFIKIAAGAVGTYLQGKGAGVLPAYEQSMPPLTTQGDLLFQGATVPERVPLGTHGQVLRSRATPTKPEFVDLFNLLTTRGDLWVRGGADPQRIAAGLLDTYFKGQGAGNLPIYEKMTLRDTGVAMGTFTRSTAGDLVITGVGFLPSVIIILAIDATPGKMNWSVGFSIASTAGVIASRDDGTVMQLTVDTVFYVERAGANRLSGVVSALDSDGFTITFTLLGAVSASATWLAIP